MRSLQSLSKHLYKNIPSYFTLDPHSLSESNPFTGQNLVGGKWVDSNHYQTIIDPMNGDKFINVPDTQEESELK